MTAKEKAEELLEKFNLPSGLMSIERKQCALIAAKEIWDELESARVFEDYKFWQEVIQEIEKL